MKTKLLLILLAFSVSNIFAQTESLKFNSDIDNLNRKISNLESKVETIQAESTRILRENESIKRLQTIQSKDFKQLSSDFEIYKQTAENIIDSLQNIISSNSANIKKTTDELGLKIEDTHESANQSITDLSKTVSQNTLHWIIAISVVALLVFLVFIFLRKQIFKQKTDLDSSLRDTRKALEEEGVKLDKKLIEVLETQLKIINNTTGPEKETDHTLALKVADEIVRIEKNISKMDNETKGIKPLAKGIERIKDNFKANGYDMVQLLEKEYDDGMNIDVINFIDDDTIPSGKKIITRIIKPQVNYRDVLIQRAQVDVSQN